MNIKWLQNPDNVVYADINKFADHFGSEIGIADLKARIKKFADNPNKEGETIVGKKRTAVKLFIPDLMFEEHIEMGENVWLYMGESYEYYCIYGLELNKPESYKYKFFQHDECEFFPCHATEKKDEFNCLFCYCPLYAMVRDCGGNFRYLDNGVKDCSGCMVPHKEDNYNHMQKKIMEFYETLRER